MVILHLSCSYTMSVHSFSSILTSDELYVYCADGAVMPGYMTPGSAGLDISAMTAGAIGSGSSDLVSTGVYVILPRGCYGRLASRSGLARSYGISVEAGVIDGDYRGEVKVLLRNHSSHIFQYERGQRIAQLLIERLGNEDKVVNQLTRELFEDVCQKGGSERKAGGFGSTGLGGPVAMERQFMLTEKNMRENVALYKDQNKNRSLYALKTSYTDAERDQLYMMYNNGKVLTAEQLKIMRSVDKLPDSPQSWKDLKREVSADNAMGWNQLATPLFQSRVATPVPAVRGLSPHPLCESCRARVNSAPALDTPPCNCGRQVELS